MSRVYGLVGWPITASRSPAMHRAAFAALGIDARYDLFPVAPGALPDAMRDFRARGVDGLNVTVPYKIDVLAHLDALDELAREVGAVNTIVRAPDGTLHGTNTDVHGLVAALAEERVEVRGRRAVVIGAGGAARAAIVALRTAGASRITVVARDVDRARELATRWALDCVALSDVRFDDASIVVQATPATLVAALPLDRLPAHAVVVDLSYGGDNALVASSRTRGLHAVDGLGMLLHQGALAFELWTGLRAPLDVMRSAVNARG